MPPIIPAFVMPTAAVPVINTAHLMFLIIIVKISPAAPGKQPAIMPAFVPPIVVVTVAKSAIKQQEPA
jgi:hypothetical protein